MSVPRSTGKPHELENRIGLARLAPMTVMLVQAPCGEGSEGSEAIGARRQNEMRSLRAMISVRFLVELPQSDPGMEDASTLSCTAFAFKFL